MLHKTVEDKISLYFFVPIKDSTSLTGEEGDIYFMLFVSYSFSIRAMYSMVLCYMLC